jgi:hypothetical protein
VDEIISRNWWDVLQTFGWQHNRNVVREYKVLGVLYLHG